MMPKVLWETTLNPRTRRLLRVEVTDQTVTDLAMGTVGESQGRRTGLALTSDPSNASYRLLCDTPPRRSRGDSMPSVSIKGTIARPLAEVFPFVADCRNDPKWAPMSRKSSKSPATALG